MYEERNVTITKEQIAAAAKKRCKSKDFDLGDGVKVSVRELTRNELKDLNKRLFILDDKGEPAMFDKDGKPTTGDGWYHFKEGVDFRREWLKATMTPAEAVDAILSDDVPGSLQKELFEAARKLSGITVEEAAGN